MSDYRTGPLRRLIAGLSTKIQTRLMLERLAYPPNETALVIVDAQRDLLDDDAPGSDLVIDGTDRGDRLAALQRLTIELRGLGIPVLFTTHASLTDATTETLTVSQRAIQDRALFQNGSPGADLTPALHRSPDDVTITPHTTLSAFVGTNLGDELERRHIGRIVVAGAITETTLDATARSAVERGLQVTVATDACLGSPKKDPAVHLEITLPRIVHAVLPIDDIIQRAKQSATPTGT